MLNNNWYQPLNQSLTNEHLIDNDAYPRKDGGIARLLDNYKVPGKYDKAPILIAIREWLSTSRVWKPTRGTQ